MDDQYRLDPVAERLEQLLDATVQVAKFLPAVAGFLMEKELAMLGQVHDSPARPFVAVISEAKVSDKIA